MALCLIIQSVKEIENVAPFCVSYGISVGAYSKGSSCVVRETVIQPIAHLVSG
jgi:hypothetical protein